MLDINEAMRIIRGSKRFDFEGSVLVVSDYYTGKSLRIDFENMDEEILEQLQVEEEEEEWYE